MYLFHTTEEAPSHLSAAARSLRNVAHDCVVFLVDSGIGLGPALLEQFGPVLTEAITQRLARVALVMTDGASNGVAAEIAATWPVEVVACDGVPVVGPDGTLFTQGQWVRFAGGLAPDTIGRRFPPPAWQPAFARLAADTADGHRIDQIPAGALLRPASWGAPAVPSLAHTVPVEATSAALVVGGPGAGETSAEAVASVLAALPAPVRAATRLVPWSGDSLPLARDVTDLLGTEIEVMSGMPLLVDTTDDTAPESRTFAIRADGTPTWHPYLEAVACPDDRNAAPTPTRWRPPYDGLEPGPSDGTYRLTDHWLLAVTRAGLWIGGPREWPGSWERPLDTEVLAIDLGTPGTRVGAEVIPALDRLLTGVGTEARAHAMLQVHSTCEGDVLRDLRRLAVRHGIGMAPRGWLPGRRSGGAPVPLPAPASRGTAPTVPGSSGTPIALTSSTAPALEPRPVPETRTPDGRVPGTTTPPPGSDDRASGPGPVVTLAEGDPQAVSSASGLPPWLTAGTPVSTGAQKRRTRAVTTAEGTRAGGATTGGATTEAVAPTTVSAAEAIVVPSREADAEEAVAPSGEADPPVTAKPVRPRPIPAPPTETGQAAGSGALAPGAGDDIRSILGSEWQVHDQAVLRGLTRLPSVRGHADEALRAGLVAVRLYLAGEAERLPVELRRASLGSGLRRLPSYRGPALRGVAPDEEVRGDLVPGTELRSPDPVSALATDRPVPKAGRGGYLIWSSTARRVRPLLDGPETDAHEEVVFCPGTRLRVLGTHDGPGGRYVLLKELPESAPASVPGHPDAGDAPTEERLLAWLADSGARLEATFAWPGRCTGDPVPTGRDVSTLRTPAPS
ncbi:hypothetical protein [Streptomyces sp. NPDC058955]|uniref:hypothetical protein n=1 Tax=unclassified Streptomyces TaxID=2593676 RepID=UPI0036650393